MFDLIVLFISEFDIILGMDWLSTYNVKIDYFSKTVCLRIPSRVELVVTTSWGNPVAEAFLSHIEKALQWDQNNTLRETRVVSEYEDIFQDIPSLLPLREVEFCIEL